MTVFISDNIDFKSETVTRDKERHYVMEKGSVHLDDRTIINIYTCNIRIPKYIKH